MKVTRKINFVLFAFIFSISNVAHANRWNDAIRGLKSYFSKGADESADTARNGSKRPSQGSKASDGRTVPQMLGVSSEFHLDTVLKPVSANPSIKLGLNFTANVVEKLMRTRKASFTFVAPAGRGKTVTAQGLQALIDAEDPLVRPLWGKKLHIMNVADIIGGTNERGTFEARIASFLKQLEDPANSNKIIVFDELENIFADSTGTAKVFLDQMKTYMASDSMDVKMIFNITNDAFFKYMVDGQHVRRMPPVFLEDLNDEMILRILSGAAKTINQADAVDFSEEQLRYVLRISKEHPTLGNPDVAVTILENAAIKAVYDRDVIDKRILSVHEKLSNITASISEIENGRKNNRVKYFGPYFDQKLVKLIDEKKVHESLINSYEEAIGAVDVLRRQMGEKIQARAALSKAAEVNKSNGVMGGGVESISADQLTDEIFELSKRIQSTVPFLVAGEVKDRHIIQAGAEYINLNTGYVERLIDKGDDVVTRSMRIANEIRSENIDAITAIVAREKSLRATGQSADVPGFLIISDDVKSADELVGAVVKDLVDTKVYKVDSSEIKNHWDMTSVKGSAKSLIGSDQPGAIFKHISETSGNMGILFSGVENAIPDLMDTAKSIIANKKLVNNANSADVSFAKSTVFLTARINHGLSPEDRIAISRFRTETERQSFLRNLVQENYVGRVSNEKAASGAEHRFDPELLSRLHVVLLDTASVVDDGLKRAQLSSALKTKVEDAITTVNDVGFEFTERTVDYLFALMQSSGINNVNDVIDYQVIQRLQSLIGKTIIPGDSVIVDTQNGQLLFVKRKWTSGLSRNDAVSGSVRREALDPLDNAIKLLDR